MLTIKLSNGFEMEADSVNEIYDGHTKTSNLNIRCPVDGAGIATVRKHLTPENLSHITVFLDGDEIDEHKGYGGIISIDKTVTRHERTLDVRLRAGV